MQPIIPPKRFDIFPLDWGMLRRFACVQIFLQTTLFLFSEKNLNASRPSEQPPVREKNVITFGTNPIRRDSFVRTDQSQTSLTGKYWEIRPMKDDFCKDFIRTGRDDWRAWCISHSTMR